MWLSPVVPKAASGQAATGLGSHARMAAVSWGGDQFIQEVSRDPGGKGEFRAESEGMTIEGTEVGGATGRRYPKSSALVGGVCEGTTAFPEGRGDNSTDTLKIHCIQI